jgi:chromosome partitioning protein
MFTVAIASGKGGTCKTSLTAALAVCATAEARRVAIIDLNADQASLTAWWLARGRPANPYLVELEKLATDLRALAATGWQFCIIDTPPDAMDVIEAAVFESDAVVIPVRAASLDIEASRAIVDIAKRRRKPHAYILAAVDTRPAFRDVNKAALADLAKLGPVLGAQLPYRKAYITAMAEGKTGHEVDTTLAREVAGIWKDVKAIGGKRRG